MINKFYNLKCQGCCFSESFFANSSEYALQQAKDKGWIFKRKNHYCNRTCAEKIVFNPKSFGLTGNEVKA